MEGIKDPNQATETQRIIKHDEAFRSFLFSRPLSANSTGNNGRGKIYNKEKLQKYQLAIKVFSNQ